MENKALYNIGYGLYVITTKNEDKMNGMIGNTVMQVTDNPAVLMVAINKNNFSCELIEKTKKFNVCVLTISTPFELISRFGFSSGRDTEKFAGFTDYELGANQIPYLTKNTNSYFEVEVIETFDFGSHLVFKSKVCDAKILSNEETLTYSYYHSHVKSAPKQNDKTVYRCEICGYEYEGEDLPKDYICPICKHGVNDFVKIVK